MTLNFKSLAKTLLFNLLGNAGYGNETIDVPDSKAYLKLEDVEKLINLPPLELRFTKVPVSRPFKYWSLHVHAVFVMYGHLEAIVEEGGDRISVAQYCNKSEEWHFTTEFISKHFPPFRVFSDANTHPTDLWETFKALGVSKKQPLFAVSDECIACGACYNIAPDFFSKNDQDYAFVENQPKTVEEVEECRMRVLKCPVDAISEEPN